MTLQSVLIQQLLTVLITQLSPEVLKMSLDKLLDIVEEAVAKTDNSLDDIVVLGLCSQIRRAFNVPDND